MKKIKNRLNKILPANQPVPYISDNITTFITEKLKKENYDFLVEYGSGNSTRYFLSKLLEFGKQCTFVSVEYNSKWFKELVKFIKTDLSSTLTSEEQFELRPWNFEKCKLLSKGENTTRLNVPSKLKRLSKAKKLFGGPFNTKMLLYRIRKESRPIDGQYSITIANSIQLLLLLRSELMKDQYGESPVKEEYIRAALAPVEHVLLSEKTLNAVFLIDGGPRSDILNLILELEERNSNFVPTIFLCDANRSFYANAMGRRPTGVFLKGSNKTLNGEPLYEDSYNSKKTNFWFDKEKVSSEELMEKEVWFYQSKVNRTP